MCSCRRALQLYRRSALRRKMHFAQCCFATRQIEPRQHRTRQAFGHSAAHALKQVEDDSALPSRGQPASAKRFIDWRDAADLEQTRLSIVARIGQDFKLRLHHFAVACRARGLNLAVNRDGLTGMKLSIEIFGIEPHALQHVPSLAQSQLEDGHLACPQQNGAANLRDNAGHLARLQLIEAARVLAIFITKRKVVEQVLRGQDALLSQHLRHARTHPANIHDSSVEAGHTPDANAFWSSATARSRCGSPDEEMSCAKACELILRIPKLRGGRSALRPQERAELSRPWWDRSKSGWRNPRASQSPARRP